MDERKENDLFNNPMVDAARKAMTPEQQEEYKRVGEYMYNSVNYRINEVGSKVQEAKQEDLVLYASQALNSGLDPHDLSPDELRALIDTYGEEWYTRFDYTKEEVPQPSVQLVSHEEVKREMERRLQFKIANNNQRRKKGKK